ncbi:MAG: GTP 3',8-cyclase MoaA [Lachnospiraceae bacterium]|nr:GTP 3',8-cyclase MoaA [Lachnospiraceae bacterium]
MVDCHGREINYMRISITDKCNLRCRYCMPDGVTLTNMSELLSYEEIVSVCQQAVSLGITRFKVTGGEPLVRREADKLVAMIKEVPGVEQVTLTTNGILLKEYAEKLKMAGIDGINVSLDTLNAEKFREITGFDALNKVLEGIDAALKAGLKVKINSVLTKDNADYRSLISFAQEKGIVLRFIEMMPIGYGKEQEGISNRWILDRLEEEYGKLRKASENLGNGPAVYYRLPGKESVVGFISAIHGKFCSSCNRIRMTAMGEIKPCLCYDTSISVKEPLRAGNMADVKARLIWSMAQKPYAHCFEEVEKITEAKKMVQIGG